MKPRKPTGSAGKPPDEQAEPVNGRAINAVPRFFELQAWLMPAGDMFDLYVTFKADMAEFGYRDDLIEVRASSALLLLHLDGLEEDQQSSKFGEFGLETEHRSKARAETVREVKLSGRTTAKGVVSPISALGSASVEGAMEGRLSTKVVENDVTDVVRRRVIAKPGGNWTFSEPDGSPLSGDYLLREKLCSLRRKEGANRFIVKFSLLVRKKHLKIDHSELGLFDRLSHTKKKILDVFLDTILADQALERINTYVSFCTVEIEL